MEGGRDPLECVFCIATSALQGLRRLLCPRVKKGKNYVLKSRLFSGCLCWRLVIAASEVLSSLPL